MPWGVKRAAWRVRCILVRTAFRAAVPSWGQSAHILLSSLSPKRDGSPTRKRFQERGAAFEAGFFFLRLHDSMEFVGGGGGGGVGGAREGLRPRLVREVYRRTLYVRELRSFKLSG